MRLSLPSSLSIVASPWEVTGGPDYTRSRGRAVKIARYWLAHESGLRLQLTLDQRVGTRSWFTYGTVCCGSECGLLGIERAVICMACRSSVALTQEELQIQVRSPAPFPPSSDQQQEIGIVEKWLSFHLDPLTAVLDSPQLYSALMGIAQQREALLELTEEVSR